MSKFPIDNPVLASAIIEAIDKKNRDESFIRYWEPFPYERRVFEKFTPKIKILIVAGGNRCLAGDTAVATPSGYRAIDTLERGDLVIASDGLVVPVLETYRNGSKPVYRWYGKKRATEVSLDCTENHKIVAATQKNNTPRLVEIGKLGTRSYLVRSDGMDFGREANRYALLLGLLLGDGYLGADIQWTCAEPALVEELRSYIEGLGITIRSRGIQHCLTHSPRLREELKRLNLAGTRSGNKFIPGEVWNWKKEDVAALLSGLIATDGSVFKSDTWHLSYTSKSPALIEDFTKLLADGFGVYGGTIGKGSKGTLQVSYGNKQALERLSELPIPGRKGRLLKQATFVKDSKATLVPLVDRQFLGEQETFDILIDHPSHVFRVKGNLQVSNSGKTEVGAALTTAFAEGKDYFKGYPAWSWVKDLPISDKGCKNIWIVGLDYKVLQNVIWREKLLNGGNHPGFIPKDSSIENIREADKQILLTEGRCITGMSADSGREKFQSASVPFIWIDEECEAEIFDECYQRTVDCGGLIVVTVTPLIDINSGTKTPWIFNLWEDMKNGRDDIAFVNLSVLDNPIVPEGEKQKLLEKWKGHPEERARLFGEFVRRSGLVYPVWNRKVHVKRTNPPPDWYRVVSIDPAATGITAALWGAVDASGNIHLYREYYQSGLPVSEHVANIKTANRGDKVDIWLIDPVWGNQRTAENHKTGQQLYRDVGGQGRGLPVRLAEVNEDFGRLSAWEYIQAASVGPEARHPRVFVDPSLTNFIEEIEHYTMDFFQRGPLKGMSKDKPRKLRDHLMNAFQYMCAQKPRGKMRLEQDLNEDELRRISTNSSYF